MSPKTVIFIGRSGCGKGTQAKRLDAFLREKDSSRNIVHLETGNLFRDFFTQNRSYTHDKSKQIYETGGLQPDFLAIDLWSTFFINSMKDDVHLIIDGTPRKYHEAQVLDSAFKFYEREKPHLVFLNVSKEWAAERLKARGRSDDNKKEIEARLQWFESDVVKAINFYKNNPDYYFHDINGEVGIDAVQEVIREKLGLL